MEGAGRGGGGSGGGRGVQLKRPASKGHARESAAGCLAIRYLEADDIRSSRLMAGGNKSVRRCGR